MRNPLYYLSRLWNKLARMIIKLGINMLWDYSKKNKFIIQDLKETSKYIEIISSF